MIRKRIQLTLFLQENESAAIEKIRKQFNPVQYELIKSHVTLCREDELESIEKVIENLSLLNHNYLTVHVGAATRSSDGNGVLIPATGNNEDFQKLRQKILAGIINDPRKQAPHITLMHPRNSVCTDTIFKEIEKASLPDKFIFKKISLIEQQEGRNWNMLQEFKLKEYI